MNDNAPLSMDLSTLDTSMPLLADGIYDVRVDKAELKPTSSGGEMISVDMVTLQPGSSREGQPLGAGVHVFDNVNTKPSGKSTWDMVNRNMAAVVQAAKINGATPANVNQWAPQLVGKVLRVKIGYAEAGVSKSGKAFKAKNVIASYLKS